MAQMAIRVSGQRQRHGALLADEIAKWILQFSDNPLIPGSSLCTSRCPPPPEQSFVLLAAVTASSVATAVAVVVVAAITVIVPPAIAAGCPVVPPPPFYTHLRARESFNDIMNPTSSNKHGEKYGGVFQKPRHTFRRVPPRFHRDLSGVDMAPMPVCVSRL
jgi:hypothetical protein